MSEELKGKSPGAPCPEFEQRIVLYAADELEREERSEVEAHVAGCGACNISLAGEQRLLEVVATAADRRATRESAGKLPHRAG